MVKGVLVILDGLGDLPNKQLNGKSPLEAAITPHLDKLSRKSQFGFMFPVKQGFIPESDEAVVSIFGNEINSSTRGQLEAAGADIKVTRGDLALRANFATIDDVKKGNIIDRRVGRTLTSSEAEILAKAINKIKIQNSFIFKSTIQHRGSLVLKGGLSDNISENDLTYQHGEIKAKDKIIQCKPLDEEENSAYTANVLNEFLVKSYEMLDSHPVNEFRRKKGLFPANYLLIRGAGIEIPKLKQYKKWISICYMPLEIGFSKFSGMRNFSFSYPPLKSIDVYENLWDGLKRACDFSIQTLKKNKEKANYFYIHLKETDVPGHDNKPLEKKKMIEHIDTTLFKYLNELASKEKIKIIVTGDHSTPCSLKNHSLHPVPVLFFDSNNEEQDNSKFCERNCVNGKLGEFNGNELLAKAGFK